MRAAACLEHFSSRQSPTRQPTTHKRQMKTMDQIEITPGVASRQGLNKRTGDVSLAPQREQATDKNAIRPFRVNVPEAELAELRRRIKATRWPEKETVADTSQGVPLTPLQDLAHYWATDYDWRTCEAKLNALAPFTTEIDGL